MWRERGEGGEREREGWKERMREERVNIYKYATTAIVITH